MRLVQDPTAAAQARRYTRQWSTDHGLPERAVDDLELVVDELVTNAVKYALPPYDIDLVCVNGMVRGEVHDGSLEEPTRNTDPDYRGGFGLNIVSSRTTRWGTALTAEGKQVWFEIDEREASSH